MIIYLRILTGLLLPFSVIAQQNIDSLRASLQNVTHDSARYNTYKYIYDYYEEVNRDSAHYYADQGIKLAQRNKKGLAEIYFLTNKAYQFTGLGRYAEALQFLLEAFRKVENTALEKENSWILFSSTPSTFSGNNRLLMLAFIHHMFGVLMWQTDNTGQAILHYTKAREISLSIKHTPRVMMADLTLGRCYLNINDLDSALIFEKEAEELAFTINFKKYLGQVYTVMAGIYQKKGNDSLERYYNHKGLEAASDQNNQNSLSANYFQLTKYHLARQEKDSALYYAMKNLEVIQHLGPVVGLAINLGTVYENIYLGYKLGNDRDSLFKYQGLTLSVKDSLNRIRIRNLTEFQNATLNEQLRLQKAEEERIKYQNRIKTLFLLSGIAGLLLLAIIFYRNIRQKQKSKIKIELAYENLKATQQQLIQSEKMASLGELTAGIAHEIQNPLNFVNNFSEVSNELINEMNQELAKGNLQQASEIAADVTKNLEKIHHHGKRADAIVKGMLQHSRASTAQKEMTDINALADEYLRLAYHGLRAKDKSFNAKFDSHLDPAIPRINTIPQDIGRVILNLINNAFYSVSEKRKQLGDGYEPTVVVSTKKRDGQVEITVDDNGKGIPPGVLDKIFQPFFTTKPAGQGTGLGLSLSYDIIKNHGGSLKVSTKEGEYTKFTITLPA
jgi:two-component system NtrC family sensor kinase